MKGGGTILERLVRLNDKAHSYTYRIVTSPLPVDHYISTIKVVPNGSSSVLIWYGRYAAKGASDVDAKKTIDGIYKAGADSLAK